MADPSGNKFVALIDHPNTERASRVLTIGGFAVGVALWLWQTLSSLGAFGAILTLLWVAAIVCFLMGLSYYVALFGRARGWLGPIPYVWDKLPVALLEGVMRNESDLSVTLADGTQLVAHGTLTRTRPIATDASLIGRVMTAGRPVKDGCITLGPPVRCAVTTKADGTYFLDMTGAPLGLGWDVRVLVAGQIRGEHLSTIVNGAARVDFEI